MAENESRERMCEECGEKEAVYTISVMMGGEVTQKHLCADCMARMNMSLAAGNVKHLLSAIMSAISGTVESAAQQAQDDVVCPNCQTSLGQFTRSGRLGCPGCYRAFQTQLTTMLQQIHGHVQHAGRKPLNTEDAQRRRTRHEELTRQMEQAVAAEDFETAAILRDRIRELQKEDEA